MRTVAVYSIWNGFLDRCEGEYSTDAALCTYRANFRQSITAADGAAANGNFPSASGVQVDGGEYNVFIDG